MLNLLVCSLNRQGCGIQRAEIALVLAQVTWEVLELLHFQRSGRISLLVVAGEHFPRQFYLFIIWISHDAPVAQITTLWRQYWMMRNF